MALVLYYILSMQEIEINLKMLRYMGKVPNVTHTYIFQGAIVVIVK